MIEQGGNTSEMKQDERVEGDDEEGFIEPEENEEGVI